MKLCWLIPDDHGGGVVSVALSCVRQAQIAGHVATLLLLRPLSGWLEQEPEATWKLDSLNQASPDADAVTSLLKWLEAHPQDILVLNGCEEADAAIPYLPAELRLVYVVHDTAARYWAAVLRHEEELDAVVAVSQVVSDCFRDRMRVPNKLSVIYNGSLFPPQPDLTIKRPRDALFLGGDNPTKGAYDLVRLWKQLMMTGAFTGELHWFGHVEIGFARRVRALPGARRIHLRGRVARSEVFAAAVHCRVFLMLSRVEPFGMVTVEAMSMGAIPVAWNVMTGTREIITDGVCGLFAPLGDFKALAAVVQRALADDGKLAGSAICTARERFSEKMMWAGYAPLLAHVAAHPPAARACFGQVPSPYQAPRRYFQLLPASIRQFIRTGIGYSPRLGYWLRDRRGL